MAKMRLLAVNAFFLPGFRGGGSIQALVNLVGHLKNDFDFSVVTGNCDLNNPIPYTKDEQNSAIASQGHEIIYLPIKYGIFARWCKILKEPWNIIYANSLFSFLFTTVPLLIWRMSRGSKAAFIIAPRGELLSGAMNIKSQKKKIFLGLAKWLGLYKGVIFHATSKDEVNALRVQGFDPAKIILAGDLPPLTGIAPKIQITKQEDCLKVVFISRIAPVKNLLFVLKTLKEIKSTVVLDIIGPVVDPAYWAQCVEIMNELPSNIRANYLGSLPHEEILKAFSSRDLFFFPSHSENNGYVILESLLAGCPILLSDKTPWRNLRTLGIGDDISLNDSIGFNRVIEEFAALSPEEHLKYRLRAREFGEERLQSFEDVAATRAMFQEVVS